MEDKIKELEKNSEPIIKFLKEYYHPNAYVVISMDDVKVLSIDKGTPIDTKKTPYIATLGENISVLNEPTNVEEIEKNTTQLLEQMSSKLDRLIFLIEELSRIQFVSLFEKDPAHYQSVLNTDELKLVNSVVSNALILDYLGYTDKILRYQGLDKILDRIQNH